METLLNVYPNGHSKRYQKWNFKLRFNAGNVLQAPSREYS